MRLDENGHVIDGLPDRTHHAHQVRVALLLFVPFFKHDVQYVVVSQ
jgi:hypothetical protein